MSRAPDERFTSLLDMQAFKRRLRDNSRSQVISSRGLNMRPVEDDARALQIMGYGNGLPAAAPTHWSFGQLCSLASPGNSPASYFRETQMPAPMIADCLNYNLRFTRGVEDIGVLLTTNEDGGIRRPRHALGARVSRHGGRPLVGVLRKSRSAPARPCVALCASRRPFRIWPADRDGALLEELVAANAGKNVIAFTHKPVLGDDAVAIENRRLIAAAIDAGFAINLSAEPPRMRIGWPNWGSPPSSPCSPAIMRAKRFGTGSRGGATNGPKRSANGVTAPRAYLGIPPLEGE